MAITVIHCTREWLAQTQTWLHHQVKYLPADIEAHVVCQRVANLDQFPTPRLHALPPRSWRSLRERLVNRANPRRSAFLIEQGRRIGAKVVHSHFGPDAWYDAPSVEAIGARQVVTFYGYDVNRLPTTDPAWRDRYLELFAGAGRVLCEGPFMAGAIRALGCPADKVQVQHLGIEIGKIAFAPAPWTGQGPVRVLMCGRFIEKKGFPIALAALARVKDKAPLEITIIGDAADAPDSQAEKQRMLDAIDKGGLNAQTRLLGYQPYARMFEEASRSHIFLSPSVTASDGDTEGGAPVSLIEMAACGVLNVSSRHCDIPGIVKHMETGLLADERDIDGLAATLAWAIDNPDRWPAMLTAARHHVENEFDAANQGLSLARVYKDLVEG